jgi:hypothetical protein
MFIFTVVLLEDSNAISVLKTKPKLSNIGAPLLINLPSIALWQSIDKPSFINIGIARVFAVLELEDSAKSVEVLGVHQDLAFVDVVVVLSDADQF